MKTLSARESGLLLAMPVLSIDLEAAASEHAKEEGIDIEEIDRIDREMHRQALLNMASQYFSHRVKQEPED